MVRLQLRPTFEIPLDQTREQAMEALQRVHAARPRTERFLVFGEYGELHLPSEEHRLWSPHLSFYVLERGNTSLLLGRFAPRQEIWTTVWIVYLAMACLVFFGAVFAAAQWTMGSTPWAVWVAIGALFVLGLVFSTAHFGQQRSADQMQRLRGELEAVLADARLTATERVAGGNPPGRR